MIQQAAMPLSDLYEADETAWLEGMAELVRQGRYEEIDYAHLEEYLGDMAARDRREVESRLATLLTHFLKWFYQPEGQSRSWRGTIIQQQFELGRLTARGILRNHAEAILTSAYTEAIKRASAETGLPPVTFPAECPYTLDQLLALALPTDCS